MVSDLMWTVSKTPTNTRKSKQYDNILFSRHRSQEFTGKSGVYDFQTRFKLSEKEALNVSDHFRSGPNFTFPKRVPCVKHRQVSLNHDESCTNSTHCFLRCMQCQ